MKKTAFIIGIMGVFLISGIMVYAGGIREQSYCNREDCPLNEVRNYNGDYACPYDNCPNANNHTHENTTRCTSTCNRNSHNYGHYSGSCHHGNKHHN